MGCGPRTTGGTAVLWFCIIGILGVAASITYNYLILDEQYASSPADKWALLGGITSTSVNFRIRLASDGLPFPDSVESKLVISSPSTSTTWEQALTSEQQSLSSVMQSYGLYAVQVTDLDPGMNYFYNVQSTSSPGSSRVELAGEFKTPASEGTRASFKIAAAACAWTGSQSYIFDTIKQDHPDLQLFLHLGDFHYEDIDTTDINKRLDAVSTVLKSSGQANLFGSLPLAYTWDDHDYLGNQEPGKTYSTLAHNTAQLSYQMAFPHYPLAAATNNTAGAAASPIPVYQAFTIGTVRFIVTDLQSESSASSIYSMQQQEWLFQELQQADEYDFVVWGTSKPWIGSQTDSNSDSVFGSWIAKEFGQNRSDLSTYITDVIGGQDGPQNLLVVGGDAHMVAFDDGTNSYFGEEALDGSKVVNSFPVLQSAPLDRLGSTKGGPYTGQCSAIAFERTHQYSTLTFEFPDSESDTNAAPCIQIESFRVDQWDSKETLFSRRICGKLFRPAIAPASTTCSIEQLSTTGIALYVAAGVLLLLLGCTTCMVALRDPEQGNCAMATCGVIGTLVGWMFAALAVYAGASMNLVKGIAQYDLKINLFTSIVMLLLMCFAAFIIGCCCFKKKAVEAAEARKSNEEPFDPEIAYADDPSGTSASILRPAVVRQETSSTVSEEQLPEGIILTGGEQLRQDGLTGKGVRVAVIDSGIDNDHPGFNGQVTKQVWLRYGTPLEEDDHGTHVAGTIHLMAPDAEIYDYRVFGSEGALGVDRAIAKAIREATDAECQVINMSLGGPAPNNIIWDAVQYANSRGVLLVCASGNEGDNNPLTNEVSFPASYKECISVAAVSKRNGFPVAVFSNSNPLVDYAGIGVDVTSFKPGGGYQIMSGTSMACPHVAGLIACLMTSGGNPASSIRQVLNDLAVDIDAVGIDYATGVGFVTFLSKNKFDEILPRATKRAVPSDVDEQVFEDARESLVSSLGSGSFWASQPPAKQDP